MTMTIINYLGNKAVQINGYTVSYNEFGPRAGTISAQNNTDKATWAWVVANKQLIINTIVAAQAEAKAEEASRIAATVEFIVGGYEMHHVSVDTRKDLEEQFATIARRFPNDCTPASVKADYEETIGKKEAAAAAEKAKEIATLQNKIETAEKKGRIRATQAEVTSARRAYNNLHNEGGEGFVLAFYTQAKIDEMKARLAELTASTAPTKANIMTRAWEIARAAFAKFGGNVRAFFAQSLKLAWAESR